jgi:hypothetical protein
MASLINPANPRDDNDNITESSTDNENDDNTFKMSDTPVTGDKILSCLDQLEDKKTPDMTGISTHLLKYIRHSLLVPSAHIFTQSLFSGVVPSKLKIAKIVPTYKSADASDINNYRPIIPPQFFL